MSKATRLRARLARHWGLDLAAAGRRCLFLACGPTAEGGNWQPWWGGDVVTLNRALLLARGDVRLAFFGTPGKVFDVGATAATRALNTATVFSDEDGHDGGAEAARALALLRAGGNYLELPPLPATVREPKGERHVVWRRHVEAGHVLGRAALAALQLVRLGYGAFWLFGHDGGHGRHAGLGMADSRRGYDKGRFCLRVLLECLGVPHSFYPDGPPEH